MPVHTRIRPFNTKETYPEQALDNDLCQTVVARGRMVFVRGQIGQDLETSESVAIGDAAGQAEKAMANIAMLLEEAGSKLEHVCKITIYLIDPRYRSGLSHGRALAEGRAHRSPPASSCRRWPGRNGSWRSTPSP